MVFQFKQSFQHRFTLFIEAIFIALPETVKNQVQLEQGAPAMPFKAIDACLPCFTHLR